MSIGIAIVVVFVLYLIDKHKLWRTVGKITLWLVGIAIVLGLAVFGYVSYDDRRQAKESARLRVEAEARAVLVKVCVKLNTNDHDGPWEKVATEEKCQQNPDFKPEPKGQFTIEDIEPSKPSKPSVPRKSRHVIALTNGDLTTLEDGSLSSANFSKGDVLELVTETASNIRLRTSKGVTGWAHSYEFKLSD